MLAADLQFASKVVATGMCRNIQALARLILPDEFGVRSLTNDVATPTTPKSLNFRIAATRRVCGFHRVTDLSNVRDPRAP
jgi:hypothetical protein